MASRLYRVLGARIGNGYERAKSAHLFRDFVNAPAQITLGETEQRVQSTVKCDKNPSTVRKFFAACAARRLRLQTRTLPSPVRATRG
jgi:hypothetical protein